MGIVGGAMMFAGFVLVLGAFAFYGRRLLAACQGVPVNMRFVMWRSLAMCSSGIIVGSWGLILMVLSLLE